MTRMQPLEKRKLLEEVIHVSLFFSTAKAHRGGADHQMAEDAEELGQIQEQ